MYRRNVEDYFEMATPHIQLVTQYPNSSTWKYKTDVFYELFLKLCHLIYYFCITTTLLKQPLARSLVYNCIM